MKVICSDTHRRHAPPFQFVEGALLPYPEVPDRVERILKELARRPGYDVVTPIEVSSRWLNRIHDPAYLSFLSTAYAAWSASGRPTETGLIPDTFAVRMPGGPPGSLEGRTGYYCFETQTPIVAGTYGAALQSANCALTGSEALLAGDPCAYALCRPPGHHAARDLYGGYCYLNNAAIAAERLVDEGRVAILDLDYHHGNGTQQIFYEREDVFFLSIHADPQRKYPYFSGHRTETGAGRGKGHNLNLPLAAGIDQRAYLSVLDDAVAQVTFHSPTFLVVSLGVDICRDDPMSDLDVPGSAFPGIGERLAQARLPTLFVQEGGYNLDVIGGCVGDVLDAYSCSPTD